MWVYEKRLQFPVNIKETNAALAQAIISQYGGANGRVYCTPFLSLNLYPIFISILLKLYFSYAILDIIYRNRHILQFSERITV